MRKIVSQVFSKPTLIPWAIVGLGALFYCYEYFLRIVPSVMTPELMRQFHLDGLQIGALSAYYYHAYMPMQILVGLMMDRYGPRRLLTFACFLCAIGTLMFAGSHALAIAKLGRFLVGMGSAFAFVGGLKLATVWLPPNRFALVSGIITCLGMVGAMVGDILLRAMVDAIGWQTALYMAAVAGIGLTAVLWAAIRDANPYNLMPHHMTGFQELFKGLWAALKSPQIWFNGLVGLLLYLSLAAFAEMWGIPYLEQARGLASDQAAYANSLIFLGWAIGAPFWGWFSDYIRLRCLPITAASFSALLLICVLLYVPGLPLPLLYILMFLFGLLSSVQILVFAICRESTSIKIAGTAIALTNMIVMVGGNIFQPLIGKLLDIFWTGTVINGARIYSNAAFEKALMVLPISIFIAIILMFFIRETRGELLEPIHH